MAARSDLARAGSLGYAWAGAVTGGASPARGARGTLSTVRLQGSARRGPDASPSEFNLAAGYFFFPLIRHFDR